MFLNEHISINKVVFILFCSSVTVVLVVIFSYVNNKIYLLLKNKITKIVIKFLKKVYLRSSSSVSKRKTFFSYIYFSVFLIRFCVNIIFLIFFYFKR